MDYTSIKNFNNRHSKGKHSLFLVGKRGTVEHFRVGTFLGRSRDITSRGNRRRSLRTERVHESNQDPGPGQSRNSSWLPNT